MTPPTHQRVALWVRTHHTTPRKVSLHAIFIADDKKSHYKFAHHLNVFLPVLVQDLPENTSRSSGHASIFEGQLCCI